MMKMLAGLVGLCLCLLTGCREPTTSDPKQIEALCRALQIPDPVFIQACKASPRLTFHELQEACALHLRTHTPSAVQSWQLCLERVEESMPRRWPELVWR